MEAVVHLYEQTASGVRTPITTLRLATERITVRELIRRRVEAEVAQRLEDDARALVDANAEAAAAWKAFRSNGFFVLFDDRQVESLDEEIVLTGDNDVAFIRLVPLVGG